jgi:hypothetical protein
MSSFPLISHHLFVAAVKSKRRVRKRPARSEARATPPGIPVLEIPLELVEAGAPAPACTAWPFGHVYRAGSS